MRMTWRQWHLMRRLWLASVALLLLAGSGIAANAALRALADHPAATTDEPAPAAGFDAQDHFPGAALLYQDMPAERAAPAAGVTGTTALPTLSVSAEEAARAIAAEPLGVTAAAPFSLGAASAIDRGRALECLSAAIYYEAATEPDAGQQAVAQVILNRVRHPAFPATVCGVVYQGSERAGCQFSFACDGAMQRTPNAAAWARAARAAALALAGRVFAPVGLATHYHTYAVTPAWNRSLVMTDAVGAHFFHRWKGYWGTAAAFRQRYRGGEPLPGPHTPTTLAPVLASIPSAPPVTTATAIRPAYAGVSTPIAPPAEKSSDKLPAAPDVLARWKDAGTMR